MSLGLEGRRAVVTGGASGVGAAVIETFVAAGARVVSLDRQGVSGIEGVRTLVADVADGGAVDAAMLEADDWLGGLDVVVHAAGVDDVQTKALVAAQRAAGRPLDVFTRIGDDQWRLVTGVNLDGTFHVLRAALRVLVPQRSGAVVAIGSEAGVHGLPGLPNYSASKGGVHALVRSVAVEVAAHGVRVNAIAPGVIDTPMSRRSSGLFGGVAEAPVAPVGRKGSPAEVAAVAAFLASDLASYVVGEVVNVDGGRTAS